MALSYRVIARLDVKGPNLIKGIQFEGLRVLVKPEDFARKYADEGADELLYIDTVASLYGRNQLEHIIERTTENVFIPITVAGGISSVGDCVAALRHGADRVAVNTAAIRRPNLIREIVGALGSQALTGSIEAKRVNGGWEAYTDHGRIPSGRSCFSWAEEAARLGVGELLITSIDCDGARRGVEFELLKQIDVDVPVIYSGGIRLKDVAEIAEYTDGMAIGASLHYGDCTISQVKDELRKAGKEVR